MECNGVYSIFIFLLSVQPWAKIKDMDDNNVELKLDTNRLVGERKPKKPSLFRRKETSTQADVRRTKDVIIMMDLGVFFFLLQIY